jgi:hypothetical protein
MPFDLGIAFFGVLPVPLFDFFLAFAMVASSSLSGALGDAGQAR